MFSVKNLIIGKPLENSSLAHEKLTKIKALAVYSSDALSSVAYATEEILWVLAPIGAFALSYALPVSGVIVLLLATLIMSYRKTIFAYPSGGGAYIVAKDNLGQHAGLIAGASLVIDYILTVSVSIASGVAAITSAFPSLLPHTVALCLFFVLFLMVVNLRGIKEAATVFTLPTYIFIFSLLTLIGVGVYKHFMGLPISPAPVNPVLGSTPQNYITLWILAKAFSSGCTALTGVEAISNGVPNFKEPRSRNAAITLVAMGIIIVFLFGGTTFLAQILHVTPNADETVISQIARVLTGRGWFYYLLQASTAAILILAANTSYNDFPLVFSLIAKDGYLPRQFSARGDKLVFSNGIVTLSILAALLLFIFGGDTHNLLPLYAIGVFLSFTLSQVGMVVHWRKIKEVGWKTNIMVNGFGATLSGIVLLILATEKFMNGAWIVIVLIPLLVLAFLKIHKHYVEIAKELSVDGQVCEHPEHIKVIVPVATFTRVVVNTIEYATSISSDVTAVHIVLDEEKSEKLKSRWGERYPHIPLVTLPSPYRAFLSPLLQYLEGVEKTIQPHELIMVLIPEFITHKWWQYFLHNQTGWVLKSVLFFNKNYVIASVPYHISERQKKIVPQ
ncbi:amino acid transporter [Desulfosporosinus acidiphilus SJ4]|uniref:Amino acid transporter n=1 Tax=Desulfosporosinus acidiphilus (strain DSM 22704 / JCM 16185 / SJ4) TaxID=646529 RepID=I4D2D0_DESAJ|nr:APC family permease [Desulfosporosinus acidiphilus]AFM39954.1 amino acid transporter [Desulfosporosinus acidiphilus SJ4]